MSAHTIAATGHRPDKLGGYSTDSRDRLLQFALQQLDLFEPSIVISGFAQGWDTAIAQAAALRKIELHAYLPFSGQELVWPDEAQKLFHALLRRAARVRIVCEGEYAPFKMQNRNEAMVDDADLVLALWDGSVGGTANCLRYARRQRRSVINVWPDWLKFRSAA